MDPVAKKLVGGLAAALALTLLIIAFLLGRMSRPEPTATREASAATPSTPPDSPGSVPVQAPDQVSAAPAEQSAGAPPASAAAAPPSLSQFSAPSASTATTSALTPERQAIASYFAQVDRLDSAGSGDPQAFAQSVVGSLSAGDFSSFDDLLTKSRAQRDKLRALVPPPSCAAYHRLASTLATDSVAMMEKLKAAIARGDTTALLTMASEARAMESQTATLKTMGDALRQTGRD